MSSNNESGLIGFCGISTLTGYLIFNIKSDLYLPKKFVGKDIFEQARSHLFAHS